MGQSSEWAIELHNERMDTDERYAADYEESMQMDAALEAEFFEQELENEKQINWFDDKPIDHAGELIQIEPKSEAVFLIDDDLPF